MQILTDFAFIIDDLRCFVKENGVASPFDCPHMLVFLSLFSEYIAGKLEDQNPFPSVSGEQVIAFDLVVKLQLVHSH